MTSIILKCEMGKEKDGVDFQLHFGQEGEATVEEKSAAIFLMPYIKGALEMALQDAEKMAQQKEASAIIKPEEPKIIVP